jgi:hypothetical protein
VANSSRGVCEGLFIAPNTKRTISRLSTGQVRWTSLESDVKPLETGPRPDKSGGPLCALADKALESGLRPDKSSRPDKCGATTGQVQWGSLESGPVPLESGGPMKPRNGNFVVIHTSTFPQTFLMCPS